MITFLAILDRIFTAARTSRPLAGKFENDLKGVKYSPDSNCITTVTKEGILKIKPTGSNKGFLLLKGIRLSSGDSLSELNTNAVEPYDFNNHLDYFTDTYDVAARQKQLDALFDLCNLNATREMQYQPITEQIKNDVYAAAGKGRKVPEGEEDLSKKSFDEWKKIAGKPKVRKESEGISKTVDYTKLEDWAMIATLFDELEMKELEIDLKKMNLKDETKIYVVEVEFNTNLLQFKNLIAQSRPIYIKNGNYYIMSMKSIKDREWFYPVIFLAIAAVLLPLSILFVKTDVKEKKA